MNSANIQLFIFSPERTDCQYTCIRRGALLALVVQQHFSRFEGKLPHVHLTCFVCTLPDLPLDNEA